MKGTGGVGAGTRRKWRRELMVAFTILGVFSMVLPFVLVVSTRNVFAVVSARWTWDTVPPMSGEQQFKDGKPAVVPTPMEDGPEYHPAPGRKKEKPSYYDGKSCLDNKYGSFCFWSVVNRLEMNDTLVKKVKDQLFMARAYHPSISNIRSERDLAWKLKQHILEYERLLGETTVDAEISPNVVRSIEEMDRIIEKAKSFNISGDTIGDKLKQNIYMIESEADFHIEQSAFLHQINVDSVPKSMHCFLMKLTEEYFSISSPVIVDNLNAENTDSSAIQHYVIFSKNVLASSVTVNSTVTNAKESKNLVFYVVTDWQNYYSMKFWFSTNSYKAATIHVLNIDDLNLENVHTSLSHYFSVSEEFRVSVHNNDQPSLELAAEYLSVFGHTHFLLPDIFKNLKKVILLDDDVVVQKDLSPLWKFNLEGKVNAAVPFCNIKLNHLKKYLGRSSYKNDSCSWMTGLNVVDLEKWREHDITSRYRKILQELASEKQALTVVDTLPASYLVFQDLIYPLDESLVLSGLGMDFDISKEDISEAHVLHYNGNMKPWLQLGIYKYKEQWIKYLTKDSKFMVECNVK